MGDRSALRQNTFRDYNEREREREGERKREREGERDREGEGEHVRALTFTWTGRRSHS